MYFNCINKIRQFIYKSDKKKYAFISPFYWNWNNRPYFRASTVVRTGEVSAIGCESRKNKILTIDKPKPAFYILLSLAGGIVHTKKETPWETEKIIAQKIQEAKSAIQKGNVFKAKTILEDTVSLYGNTMKIQVGMSCVYEMLATIAYQNNEVERAQALLMTAVDKLLHSGMKNNDNTVTNFTLKLARIYDKQNRDDLAELGYKNCIALQKHKYMTGQNDNETGLLWINALYWYGKFLESRKRFMEAKQCFDSSYTLCGHVKTIQPLQIMVILYDLAEMSAATGDLEAAQRHYLNAIILGRDHDSKDLPIYYVKLGLTNLYKGLNEEAYIWCDIGRIAARRKKDKHMEDEAIKCLQQLKMN